jgi:hypothetical protein
MENAMSGDEGAALSEDQSAVQNSATFASKFKLVLVWLAVGLPLLWGAMKALEDIGSLPL